jgi:hypothetical protein
MPPSPPSEGQPLASPTQSAAAPNTSAQSRQILINLGSAILCLSFFLPWIKILGAGLNGVDIQKNLSSYRLIWLMPLLAIVVLALNVAKRDTSFVRRLAGLCPFVILAYALNHLGSDLFKLLEFGAWLALISGAALVLIPGERKTPA